MLKAVLIPLAVMAMAIAAALWLGGPGPIAPMASINEPFAKVDFSAVPPNSHYTARDGTQLAWLHYPPANPGSATRRVVLVHGSSARGRSMHPMAQALAAAGFDVAALDLRGHGDSGERGHIAYIGQLEDDLEDFMTTQAWPGPTTLLGFSSAAALSCASPPTRAPACSTATCCSRLSCTKPRPPSAPATMTGSPSACRASWV